MKNRSSLERAVRLPVTGLWNSEPVTLRTEDHVKVVPSARPADRPVASAAYVDRGKFPVVAAGAHRRDPHRDCCPRGCGCGWTCSKRRNHPDGRSRLRDRWDRRWRPDRSWGSNDRWMHRAAAIITELGPLRVGLAAFWTSRHTGSLPRSISR